MRRFEESATIEYKRELTENFEREVIAFLNSREGGTIFLGIDAEHQTVTGLKNVDAMQLAVKDRIKNNILPSALGLFDVHLETLDDRSVLRIKVAAGYEKPYYLKKYGMSEKGCFQRIGSAAEPMNTKQIEDFFFKRSRNTIGLLRSPQQKLSFQQLKIFYQEAGFELNDNFAQTLELLAPDGQYNYAAYLLADANGTSIKVAKYSGTDRVDLTENNEYGYCCLIKATQRVLDKLDVENRTFTKITSKRRLQKRMIEANALREAVINAIVHNDYSYEAPPKFELFSDRMEITSTGGLPFGLNRNDFYTGVSVPRNKELMRVFRDMELVEYLGSGIPRILRKYDASVFHLSDNFTRIVFPYETGYPESLEISPSVTPRVTPDEGVSEGVSEGVRKVFVFIRNNPLCRVPRIAKGTGIPVKTVERYIRKLKAEGKIEFTGAPKTGGYRLIAGEE
ncbi:MAG TPA: putative DNA binding domain-containing protein [Smithellaceae bacterium]|jgi:ATP-dependent DNA helicase RecG|nr:putative DNA binding domain-containing protein [Smithellaceae bacterium]HOS15241.1 putative DNA binding domain-containing protein [Smithella sp.]